MQNSQTMKATETYEEYLSRMELYRLLEEAEEDLAAGNHMSADEFFAEFWKEKENELQHRSIGSRKG